MISFFPALRFRCDARGSVAIIFGLSVLPLCLALGSAIDYGRAFAVRSTLQNSLDAALLAAGRENLGDDAAATAHVRRYFDANWEADYGAHDVNIRVKSSRPGHVRGQVDVDVPTTVMRVIGMPSINVGVEGEAEAGTQDVEISLVLDNTHSMLGSKLAALKQSARVLVDAVFAPPGADEHVKVALVPFANYVNVGMANRNASWMSVPNDSSTTTEWCREERPVVSRANCRMETRTGSNDGVPYSYETEVCDITYGDPVTTCTPSTDTQTWWGCAGSRTYPLDVRDDTYSTPVPGIMNASCPGEITPLTNVKSTVLDRIDAMAASGDTYIPSGLFWGWTTLSSQEPFAEAVPYGTRRGGRSVRKALVLMTDGHNTRSPNYPNHWGSDTTQANTLTAELCTNAKAEGVEIFTVAFEVTDTVIKDILRACATAPSNFFDADDAAELEMAFGAIARDMTALHLAK